MLISKTTNLQSEKQDVEVKLKLANSFINKFQLSNDELNALCNFKDNHLHKVN